MKSIQISKREIKGKEHGRIVSGEKELLYEENQVKWSILFLALYANVINQR